MQSRCEPGARGATDVIELVLGQGIAALSFAVTYAARRTARPSAPAVIN
ncbi:effector-associated constant component EACC1 [Streptomyces sp. 8N706]